jgi:hypothetical protein
MGTYDHVSLICLVVCGLFNCTVSWDCGSEDVHTILFSPLLELWVSAILLWLTNPPFIMAVSINWHFICNDDMHAVINHHTLWRCPVFICAHSEHTVNTSSGTSPVIIWLYVMNRTSWNICFDLCDQHVILLSLPFSPGHSWELAVVLVEMKMAVVSACHPSFVAPTVQQQTGTEAQFTKWVNGLMGWCVFVDQTALKLSSLETENVF